MQLISNVMLFYFNTMKYIHTLNFVLNSTLLTRTKSVLHPAGARLAKTLVIFVVPYSSTRYAATMEEPALGGARRVQVTVAAMLPMTISTVVAIEDSARSGRTA